VSEPTFSPVSVVADTIVRTVELGVTITGAAIEDAATVVWCDLLKHGAWPLPGLRHSRDIPGPGRAG